MVQAMLELKMIADVGIVGLPNAGKSTLLSIISNAKPTIANYPFTTLRPNLGVVDVDKKDSLLFADIPGLIEGASTGKGLGDEFLRHVERTSVLVHLIDVYNQDISAAYKTIIKELASYKVDLSSRPQIVALTKTEGMPQKDLDAKLASLKKLVPRGTEVLAISGASGEGVQDLLRLAQKSVVLDRKARAKLVPKNELPVIGLKDIDEPWQVKKNGKKFVVTGTKIENFAGRTDFSSSYGQERLLDIMRKMGIVRELEKQGIEPEQVVVVGNPKIGQLKY